MAVHAPNTNPNKIPYGAAPPAYRLPMGTHVGPVTLQISDLTRSLAYYQTVLGLTLLSQQDNGASLGTPNGTPLVTLRERPSARPVSRNGLLGLYHFAILLPDTPSLGRFVGHLAALRVPAGMSDHAVSQAIYLTDPDGLGIEVYADRPRSIWEYNARELHMISAPLDLAVLREAAGTTAWTGIPEGTVMGHIHLHVSDLDAANMFYHVRLGLDRMVWSYPGALFLAAGGYHHHLGLNTWARGARPATDDDARLLDWTLFVPTLEDAAAATRSLGAEAHANGDAEAHTWTAVDPWGNRLIIRPETE
jgi:catechol 2,3-dioxygenase